MRVQFVKQRLARLSDDSGWVMMDAVWSSVVVIMAFMATFMALENGTRTATRDVGRTTAYDLAQDELAGLRDLGKRDLNELLSKNNSATPPSSPSKSVTLNGKTYHVWYSAYYVTGLGNNTTDACGGTYGSNGNGTAKFVYIKATVQYEGQPATDKSPTLDEYFAPEGGDTNAATGTLRVYMLKPPNDAPWVGMPVSLVATGVSTSFDTQSKVTGPSGCVLFTGLPRGNYNIVSSTSKYDIYLNNPSGNSLITEIQLPDRAALSKDVRLESPVKVPYDFFADSDSAAADLPVVPSTNAYPSTSGTGASPLVGPWIARNSQILKPPSTSTDFKPLPGSAFMPHGTWLPSFATSYLYPEPGGYDTFAGPCDVNQPTTTLPHVPVLNNLTYTAGGTYQESGADPIFKLPRLNVDIRINNRNNDGTPYVAGTSTILGSFRDKQIKKFSTDGMYGGRAIVKLINGPNTSTPATGAICGPRQNLFNSWVRLRGTTNSPPLAQAPPNTPTPNLLPEAEVLPQGLYDVCLRAYVQGSKYVRTNTWNPPQYGWVALSEWRYKSARINLNQSYVDDPYDLDWDPFTETLTNNPGLYTDCGGGTTQWSP